MNHSDRLEVDSVDHLAGIPCRATVGTFLVQTARLE